MKEKLIKIREEVCQKQEELAYLWVEYVKEQKEISLKGYNVSLCDGFCEPMERMYYSNGDVVFEDAFGNKYWFLDTYTVETLKDLEFILFG
jgi:hypothetical protein